MSSQVRKGEASCRVTLVETFDLSMIYRFPSSTAIVLPGKGCRCLSSTDHYCCTDCKNRHPVPPDAELADYARILGEYDLREPDARAAVRQMAHLLSTNIPLSLFVLGRVLQASTGIGGVLPTIFFRDIAALHAFARHVLHACGLYRAYERYLESTLQPGIAAGDAWAVARAMAGLKARQDQEQHTTNRLLMGFSTGGVGVGCVQLPHHTLARVLQDNWTAHVSVDRARSLLASFGIAVVDHAASVLVGQRLSYGGPPPDCRAKT